MYSPPHVYRKLYTNARLTSKEENKVRRSKREMLIKLKAIESKTVRLRDRLSILHQKRDETEDYINIHQEYISPIRRLLPEILQEIFWRCLPTAHNSVLSFKEAPLLLGRVCSHWHQIAYSTPKLWSSFHMIVIPLTSSLAEARLEAFGAWLARSGILPLCISMASVAQSCIWSYESRPYFDLIAKYARRIKSIHNQVDLYDPFNTPMNAHGRDFPLLETLYIHQTRFMHQSAESRSLSEEDGILFAPLLRVLSVQDFSLRLLDLPLQWNQLTGLDFIPRASQVSELFKLLTLCSNLETCSMNFRDSVGSSDLAPSDIKYTVVLPKLQTLRIYGESNSHHDSLILLNNLSTPALRHFAYQHLISPYPPWTIIPFTELSSPEIFRSFFQRLNEPLEELSFAGDGLEMRYLIELLSLFPELKRLSLRSASFSSMLSVNDCLLLGFIPYKHKRHCQTCTPALDEEKVDESPDLDTPSFRCLCSKLEVFDVDDAIFSKHAIFEFLRSRLVDYDQHNVARLRRFRMTFELTIEDRVIAEEIERFAEESGMVDMRLNQRPGFQFPSIWGGSDFA